MLRAIRRAAGSGARGWPGRVLGLAFALGAAVGHEGHRRKPKQRDQLQAQQQQADLAAADATQQQQQQQDQQQQREVEAAAAQCQLQHAFAAAQAKVRRTQKCLKLTNHRLARLKVRSLKKLRQLMHLAERLRAALASADAGRASEAAAVVKLSVQLAADKVVAAEQQEDLCGTISQLGSELSAKHHQLQELKQQQAHMQQQLSACRSSHDEQLAAVRDELTAAQQQRNHSVVAGQHGARQLAATRSQLQQAQQELQVSIASSRRQAGELSAKHHQLQELQQQIAHMQQQLSACRSSHDEQLAVVRDELTAAQQQLNRSFTAEQDKTRQLAAMRSQLHQVKQELQVSMSSSRHQSQQSLLLTEQLEQAAQQLKDSMHAVQDMQQFMLASRHKLIQQEQELHDYRGLSTLHQQRLTQLQLASAHQQKELEAALAAKHSALKSAETRATQAEHQLQEMAAAHAALQQQLQQHRAARHAAAAGSAVSAPRLDTSITGSAADAAHVLELPQQRLPVHVHSSSSSSSHKTEGQSANNTAAAATMVRSSRAVGITAEPVRYGVLHMLQQQKMSCHADVATRADSGQQQQPQRRYSQVCQTAAASSPAGQVQQAGTLAAPTAASTAPAPALGTATGRRSPSGVKQIAHGMAAGAATSAHCAGKAAVIAAVPRSSRRGSSKQHSGHVVAAAPTPPGLRNLGNTCYLSSSIQSLYSLSELVNKLLSPEVYWSHKARVCPALQGLIRQMMGSSAIPAPAHNKRPSQATIDPSDLREELARHNNQWASNAQEDAHELLMDLLGVIEDECPAVHELFCGQQASIITCSCKYSSKKLEPFVGAALPLPNQRGATSLQNCFNMYMAPEVLEKDNAYHCPCCRQLCTATKRVAISRYPQVLVLWFKRFCKDPMTGSCKGKVHTPLQVDSSKLLDLTRYCSHDGLQAAKAAGQPPPLCELKAVCKHLGERTCGGGHYTAQACSTVNGSWHMCDDSNVTACKAPQGSSSSAYGLFFQLADCVAGP